MKHTQIIINTASTLLILINIHYHEQFQTIILKLSINNYKAQEITELKNDLKCEDGGNSTNKLAQERREDRRENRDPGSDRGLMVVVGRK